MTRRNGFVTVVLLVMAVVLAILSALLVRAFALEFTYLAHTVGRDASCELAKAGLEKAVYEYLQDPAYRGEVGLAFGKGTITIELRPDPDEAGCFTVRAAGTYSRSKRPKTTVLESTCVPATDDAGRAGVRVADIRIVSAGRSSATAEEDSP